MAGQPLAIYSGTEKAEKKQAAQTFTYGAQGNITGIGNGNRNQTGFVLDDWGRITEIHTPELHIDRSNTVRTRYNMDNRLLYRRAEVAKGRNAVTNQSVYYPDGRLKEAVGGGITYQYDYTANGQLRSKSSTGKSLLEYAYDRNGNITELKDLTGAVTRYTYDSINRLLRTGGAKDA